MRESISKKKRFEIFKRDLFSCQYCGSKPPNVLLEVDHILPVSKGGKNHDANLITSCFDCNRGKGAGLISKIEICSVLNIEAIKEKEKQYKLFIKFTNSIESLKKLEIREVEEIYEETFPNYCLTEKFKISSVRPFIDKLGLNNVKQAMAIACDKISHNENKALSYFCGICWNKIRGNGGYNG